MTLQYPNANYPEKGYTEANMVKATDVAVNADGDDLTVTDVAAGKGPLDVVTGEDVAGVARHEGEPASS